MKMFFVVLFLVVAVVNATEEARLFKTNEALRQALQELQAVKQQEAEEVSVGQYKMTSVTRYEKRSGIHKCPPGEELTESECKDKVPKSGFDKYKGAGTWKSETCGCYIDNWGGRYFNKLNRDSSSCRRDWYEKAICKKQVSVKVKCDAPNPYQFFKMQDGKCEYKLVYGNKDCPSGYKKMVENECKQVLNKGTHAWEGRWNAKDYTTRKIIAKQGCIVYKQSFGVGEKAWDSYTGYWNIASADCSNCDPKYARVCKRV